LIKLNKVSFADLGMVDVQHQPQMGIVNSCDQREGVGGLRERRTWMINGSVEILQAEDHSLALSELCDPGQRFCGLQPHVAGDHINRLDW
jgi:hypothetical protein